MNQELIKLLEKSVSKGFYGEISLQIQGGKIVRVVKSESVKIQKEK